MSLAQALKNPNVRAFLKMLRYGEGTTGPDGYRTMFGGQLFDNNYMDHPRKAIEASLKGKPITSTAAGAYQFLARTWTALVEQHGFPDFSPQSQDLGAVALIHGRKALDDVIAGRFNVAVAKCNREWASLPGSPYQQPVISMEKARALYEAAGGTYDAMHAPVQTEPASSVSVPPVGGYRAVFTFVQWLAGLLSKRKP
jgi:muramidase (phage lysozyme)